MTMKIVKAFLIVFSIQIMSVIFFNSPVSAVGNYSLNYTITYNINDDSTANIKYDIKLINLSDNYYADSHSLTLTQTDLSDVQVINSYGSSEGYDITKTSTTTTIKTKFNTPAFGKNSFDSWSIQYKTAQVSKSEGHVINLAIPGFSDKKGLSIDSLLVKVISPQGYSSLNFSSPKPTNTIQNSNSIEYDFNQDVVNSSGINMILGKSETYSFAFNYPVNNTSSNTESYTIAVPFDTSNQQILFNKINPLPSDFNINDDGNYILTYNVPGHTNLSINVEGIANVESRFNLLENKRSSPIELSSNDKSLYTSSMKYWEVNNTQIRSLASDITKGQSSDIDKARKIYDYLVSTFKYNKKALLDKNRERKGALYAIQNPKDVICQEYADAFIALTRSIGIPSRFIAGYGNTSSPTNSLPSNVLHAWAEFYSPDYGWIPVDPTWGSASQDFFGNLGSDHLGMAIYGKASSYDPPLVLAFTEESNDQNNVKLSPTNADFSDSPSLDSDKQIQVNGGFSNIAVSNIFNSGNRVLFIKNSKITFNKIDFESNRDSSLQYIFPKMTGSINVPITYGNILSNDIYGGNLNLNYKTFNGNEISKSFSIKINITPYKLLLIVPILAVIFIFMLSYLIVRYSIDLYYRINKNKLS